MSAPNTGVAVKAWDDSPCTKNVRAIKMKDVPSVVMNDGIFSRSVISPLIRPIPVPITSPMSAASQVFIPFVASWPTRILLMMKLAPTERSNSPAIMRTPTPSAGMPTSIGIVSSAVWMLARLL